MLEHRKSLQTSSTGIIIAVLGAQVLHGAHERCCPGCTERVSSLHHVYCQLEAVFANFSVLVCSFTHPWSLALAQHGDTSSLPSQKSSSRGPMSLTIPCSAPPTSSSDEKTIPNLRLCQQENDFHSLIYYSKKAVNFSYLESDVRLSASVHIIGKLNQNDCLSQSEGCFFNETFLHAGCKWIINNML